MFDIRPARPIPVRKPNRGEYGTPKAMTDILESRKDLKARFVLFSVVEARSAGSVAKMTRSIQSSFPDCIFLVGLWSLPSTGAARLTRKIRESARGGVYTEVAQALRSIVTLVSPAVRDLSAETNASAPV